jgi:hypothetical protein
MLRNFCGEKMSEALTILLLKVHDTDSDSVFFAQTCRIRQASDTLAVKFSISSSRPPIAENLLLIVLQIIDYYVFCFVYPAVCFLLDDFSRNSP